MALRCAFPIKLIRDASKRFYSVEGGVFRSNLTDVQIPNQTIPDLVFEKFSKFDDNKTALECVITGRNYTYKQTREYSLRFNRNLRALFKLKRQDVVAVLLPNVPEFPIVTLGILKAGLVATTINPFYTPGEINKQLADSTVKAIITLVDLYSLTKSSIKELNIPIITIKTLPDQSTPEGAINFSELVNSNFDIPDIQDTSSTDLAFLPYSSGTTGLPKGVNLLHSNIVSNICQIEHPEVKVTLTATADYQAVIPAVLPMFHIYGFTVLSLVQLICGAKILTVPRFTPELYINVLQKHKPHVLYLVPPMAMFLANHPSVNKNHFERVESVVCGAAPLGGLDEEKLLKKAQKDIDIMQGYGMTETSPCVLCTRKSMKTYSRCLGSVGQPVSNTQVKIIGVDDPKGQPLGPNQQGELLVKGPQVMPGYHNRPKDTAEVFLDGWLRTGDLMYYDDKGLFYITDRLKELIKVKGFQVAPAELEEIIRDHPDVSEAAVIGIPHPNDGEVPRALIVPKEGRKINADQLTKFVNDKVTSYKHLKGGVVVVDSIPKNTTGKILRRQLKLKHSE